MGEDVPVRPDQVSLGVLVTAVPRDAVDAAVAACGVGAKRSDGKLPAHVTAYLTMALCLFAEDDYTEVATKVTGSLSAWGCWDAGWSAPTASGITQARKRLGPRVLAEVFEQVAGPRADVLTRGAWLRDWRLVAIDGFEVDVPDTEGNAVEFGYAGSGATRSAFPKARVVALAECGTHAFLAAQVGAYSVGEKTLARGLYGRLRRDELLCADRGFYSFEAWDLASRSGAALLWRAPTGLELPVVRSDLPEHDATMMDRLFSRPMPDWSDRAAVAEYATAGAEILGDDPAAAHARAERIWDRTPGTEPAVQMANRMGMVFSKLNCTPRWCERLPELAIPVLVVHGQQDPFFPVGNGEVLAREIPGAKLLLLQQAATAIPVAAADEIAAAMLEF